METEHSEKKNEQVVVTPVIGSPKFIPILFSTVMVQAILYGRKTQTRRIIKKKYSNTDIEWKIDKYGKRLVERQNDVPAPKVVVSEDGKTSTTRHITLFAEIKHPYKKGDILWVRETFCEPNLFDGNEKDFYYRASAPEQYSSEHRHIAGVKWKPSLFMPKEACRIFLLVKSVRVERSQDISRGDAMSEGCPFPNIAKETNPVAWFAALWQKINGFKSWNDNPFVWVIEFERIERPNGFL